MDIEQCKKANYAIQRTEKAKEIILFEDDEEGDSSISDEFILINGAIQILIKALNWVGKHYRLY